MFCRDKITFLATNHVFCRDKSMLVATKLSSQQNYVCRDKIFLLRQKITLVADEIPPMIVGLSCEPLWPSSKALGW